MATTFQVTPGDLITADLFNQILTRLADLEGRVGTGTAPGTVTVPILFGRTLSAARATLTNPVNQLSAGAVFDTKGASINPTLPASGNLMVIVQMPSAGTRVAPGTTVDLIVAAADSGGGTTTQPPVINLITPNPVPVGATASVQGLRFASPPGANTVTFDGVPGEVLAGNTVTLSVKVPTGIPGAPTAPGGATKPNVNVIVRTAAGPQTPAFVCAVSAPEANKPVIGVITPSTGVVNSTITIAGTGFAATPAQNQVTFDGVAGTVTGATATSLSVTVPPGIPGLNQQGDSREDVPVIVTVSAVSSNPKIHAIARI